MEIPRKNWLEWSVFVLGLLSIGAVVGYLANDAFDAPRTGAQVVVRLGEPEQREAQSYVPITLTNLGGQAAAGVMVEVLMERGGVVVDRAQFAVDLLPRQSTRSGWAVFDSAPTAGVRARTGGVAFREP